MWDQGQESFLFITNLCIMFDHICSRNWWSHMWHYSTKIVQSETIWDIGGNWDVKEGDSWPTHDTCFHLLIKLFFLDLPRFHITSVQIRYHQDHPKVSLVYCFVRFIIAPVSSRKLSCSNKWKIFCQIAIWILTTYSMTPWMTEAAEIKCALIKVTPSSGEYSWISTECDLLQRNSGHHIKVIKLFLDAGRSMVWLKKQATKNPTETRKVIVTQAWHTKLLWMSQTPYIRNCCCWDGRMGETWFSTTGSRFNIAVNQLPLHLTQWTSCQPIFFQLFTVCLK